MKTPINIDQWKRKETYTFFKDFEEPFWGVCVNVDCTHAYNVAKENKQSFFLSYLHKALLASNHIEAFRYRIEEENVYLYDEVHASTTLLKEDNTFCFADISFNNNLNIFTQDATHQMSIIKQSGEQNVGKFGNAVIHFSALPWIHFSSISHARRYAIKCSCPKISFGKIIEVNGCIMMPLSIHVHHALIDGYTVGEFINLYQMYLNEG